MKSLCLAILFLMPFAGSQAQTPKQAVGEFFNAMYEADAKKLKLLAIPGAALCTSIQKRESHKISCSTFEEFIGSLADAVPGDLDEQVYNIREDLRPGAATVSMDYDFYYKGSFSHCGVNVFHFLNSEDGWKITGIDDTRSQLNCRGKSLSEAGKVLDDWHNAAGRADSAAYFSLMARDAVFIGTDSFEVWGKNEFVKFAAPYFAKGKAWDFVKISRNLHYDSARSMVWFDELLDTWMGPCRGSGWLALEDDKLRIKQYVLSLTVPNDKMQGVLENIGANRRPRK